MSKVPKIRLTLKKTLATTLIPLIGWTVATLYNRDHGMIGWAILVNIMVFAMYAALHLRDFATFVFQSIEDIKSGKVERVEKQKTFEMEREEERKTLKAMRPSNAVLSKAIAEDLMREKIDSNIPIEEPTQTKLCSKCDYRLAHELEDGTEKEKLKMQLDQAKSVIETQNELLKELGTNGNT